MAKEIADAQDLLRLYRRVFGEDPQITGADWTDDYMEKVIEALDTGVPIKEAPVPKGTFT